MDHFSVHPNTTKSGNAIGGSSMSKPPKSTSYTISNIVQNIRMRASGLAPGVQDSITNLRMSLGLLT